mgnify:FL=1
MFATRLYFASQLSYLITTLQQNIEIISVENPLEFCNLDDCKINSLMPGILSIPINLMQNITIVKLNQNNYPLKNFQESSEREVNNTNIPFIYYICRCNLCAIVKSFRVVYLNKSLVNNSILFQQLPPYRKELRMELG